MKNLLTLTKKPQPNRDLDQLGLSPDARRRCEREALPLFADRVAATQKFVDQEHADREETWQRHEVKDRARAAADCRRARRELAVFADPEREQLRDYWNRNRWYPGRASFQLSMLRRYRDGRLDLQAPNMINPPQRKTARANRCGIPAMPHRT